MGASEEQDQFLHETLSAVIRDAFFEARNVRQTMYQAGDDAAARVLSVLMPSVLRLQAEVGQLLDRWEAERRGALTDDWQAAVADATLKLCIDELRVAVEHATPKMPTLETVEG